jgi:hypothetical protein
MSAPILTNALASIDAALMRAKHDSNGIETLLTQDLRDALGFILEAIEALESKENN